MFRLGSLFVYFIGNACFYSANHFFCSVFLLVTAFMVFLARLNVVNDLSIGLGFGSSSVVCYRMVFWRRLRQLLDVVCCIDCGKLLYRWSNGSIFLATH